MPQPTYIPWDDVLTDLRMLYVEGSPDDREQFARMFERVVTTIGRAAHTINESRRQAGDSTEAPVLSASAGARTRAPYGNSVLDAIEREAGDLLAGSLGFVKLSKDETVFNVGDTPRYVYFPCGAVVSMLRIAESGKTVEVCPVGFDGLLGLSGLFGQGRAAHWSRVLIAGGAWRIGRTELLAAFDASPSLRSALLQFVYGQFAEISLVATCTRAHTIEQQVARWLLTVCDRSGTTDLPLTHERIADRLGTRRPSVSLALEAYRRKGCVGLGRGRISIADRDDLERVACECYRAVKSEYVRKCAA